MAQEELAKIAVPQDNSKELEDLEDFEVKNEEDQLNLGLSILGATNSLKEFTPSMTPTEHPLEVNVPTKTKDGESKEVTKELGYVNMVNSNASKVKKLLNIDSSKKLTLFHSGFNIGVADMTPAFKLALQVSLATVQAEIGITTLGIGFNNETAMVVKQVIESLETSVEVSTLRQNEPIREALVTDLQHIMLLAMDKEIIILQTCTNKNKDGTNCNHIHEYIASWKNLIHTDKTKVDLSFLGKSKVTQKDVLNFRRYITSKNIETAIEGIKVDIELYIPTIGTYIEYGEYWLAEVNKIVDLVVSEPTKIARRTMLTSTFNINTVQQYGHFIKSISIDGGTPLTDIADIVETVSLLPKDTHEQIVLDIKEYVKDNIFSVVGVPSYRCLACGKVLESENDNPYNEEVVSINMVKTFLELTNLNLTKMVNG